ncbi:10565_t:CDS:2 [Acaulospora colombiana]|uniref:10565_t:CDS:1 n=1 Tax=Acaulospora colombiana TaxID=27376 RepID=A0ACA9K1Y5_9GLOM|nr:10565_t:CDS:2 [Acaulospora colombiana]
MPQNEIYKLKHNFGESTKTALYGVSFNPYDQKEDSVFAVAGGRNIIIAHFDNTKPVALEILQTYVDENEEENYYCCVWSFDPNTGAPWLAVAGAIGLVKILNTSNGSIVQTLTGHGDARNKRNQISSENAIFAFFSEQRLLNSALECDHRYAYCGDFLVSSGMDHAVKIWSLCTPVIKNTIESSIKPKSLSRSQQRQSQTQTCCKSHGHPSTPLFDYRLLATGNQIGQIFLWDLQEIPYLIDSYIEKKKLKSSGVKMDKVVVKKKGGNGSNNKKSKANNDSVSDINDNVSTPRGVNHNDESAGKKVCKPAILADSCDSTIRQVTFSGNRQWMIAVCDDGTVWGWKLNREVSGQAAGSSRYDPMVIDD